MDLGAWEVMHLQWPKVHNLNLTTVLCGDTYLGERALDAVAGDDAAVPLVCAPVLKELPGQTTLHHAWARHHDGRTNVLKVVHALST